MVALIEKALDILERVAKDAPCSLRDLSVDCSVPMATAHRVVATLIARGYIVVERRGRYHLGPAWRRAFRDGAGTSLLAAVSRAPLANLARATGAHAHLGVLEDGMVTYLVKQQHGRNRVYSAENMQLEAYCTAIGKCLLAQLGTVELDDYFGDGPFIPLTPATIVKPADFRAHLAQVRAQGWASEVGESLPGMMCLSIPLQASIIGVASAISVSFICPSSSLEALLERMPALVEARQEIESRLMIGRESPV